MDNFRVNMGSSILKMSVSTKKSFYVPLIFSQPSFEACLAWQDAEFREKISFLWESISRVNLGMFCARALHQARQWVARALEKRNVVSARRDACGVTHTAVCRKTISQDGKSVDFW